MDKIDTEALRNSRKRTSTSKTKEVKPKEKDPKKKIKEDSSAKSAEKEKEEKEALSKKRKLFDDSNIDVNLHSDPHSLIEKKIKLSAICIVKCHMVNGADMKTPFANDFAAMTFEKKMKDGKAFEFSLPLNLAHNLKNAIDIMITSNKQFFGTASSK